MARHLLVTNDFPPKIGGIQNYLWELWRRLPADDVIVHTTPCDGSDEWDATQAYTIVRSREPWLLPQPVLIRRVNKLARKYEAEVVIIDPAVPAGLIGPHLDLPYGVVLHGAEVTIPGRVPVTRQLLNRVLRGATGVIAAGGYPADEGERSLGQRLPTTIIPPGVDTGRFRPTEPEARRVVRTRLGLDADAPLVLSVSRLVPRKGMDTLIRASVEVQRRQPYVQFAIAGTGRHEPDLRKLIDDLDAPVTLLGRVSDDDIPDLYASADVFSMLCRSRWGGLEQEGFGIVFVESAACGVAQVAGRSGGAHEAVAHNETGLIVDDPEDHHAAAQAIADLLADPDRRGAMGEAARRRAEVEFSYDVLARRLEGAIDGMINQ